MSRSGFSENQFLFIVFLLALGLSQQTFKSVFSSSEGKIILPSGDKTGKLGKLAQLEPLAKTGSRRTLASENLNKKEFFSEKIPLDFLCGSKTNTYSQKFKVNSPFIYFKGKSCTKNFIENNIQINNSSNGYTASVFDLQQSLYRTDHIFLHPGENKIFIEFLSSQKIKMKREFLVLYQNE